MIDSELIQQIRQAAMEFANISGFVIFIYMLLRKHTRKVMRVQWNSVSTFLAFLAFVTVIRIAGFDFFQDMSGGQNVLPQLPPELDGKPIWRFAIVFWEDAFFAIPLFYAWKHLRKWPAIGITIFMSLWFGSGHSYQGVQAIAITALYPYFISLRHGKKVGFGTVMACHILYDVITFYTVYFMRYLI